MELDSLLAEELQPAGAPAIARLASARPLPPSVSRMSFSRLQRSAGNAAVARLMPAAQPASLAVQRAVYKEGGKNAVAVTATAKSIADWVKRSVKAPNKNYLADVQGRGFPGFIKNKQEYAGGRVFNNNAMPDGSKLPYLNGQTYQEWDVNPCVAGQGRDGERIVTSSDGTVYYSNDHYKNFTELK